VSSRELMGFGPTLGIGLMMAKALEANGATVYILGRRYEVLEKAARENSVSISFMYLTKSFLSRSVIPNSAPTL